MTLEWSYRYRNGSSVEVHVSGLRRNCIFSSAVGLKRQFAITFGGLPLVFCGLVYVELTTGNVVSFDEDGRVRLVLRSEIIKDSDPSFTAVIGVAASQAGGSTDQPCADLSYGKRINASFYERLGLSHAGFGTCEWNVVSRGVLVEHLEGPFGWAILQGVWGIHVVRWPILEPSPSNYRSTHVPAFYRGESYKRNRLYIDLGAGSYSKRISLTDLLQFDNHVALPKFRVGKISERNVPAYTLVGEGTRNKGIIFTYGGFSQCLRPIVREEFGSLDLDLLFTHIRGGGEFGHDLNGSTPSSMLSDGLADLLAIIERVKLRRWKYINLAGTSHGGLLSLLAAITRPDLVDKVSVVAPIVDLGKYCRYSVGRRFSHYYEEGLPAMNPLGIVKRYSEEALPDLQLIVPQHDRNLGEQPFSEFADAWRESGGKVELITHSGDHFAPPPEEIEQVVESQVQFLG